MIENIIENIMNRINPRITREVNGILNELEIRNKEWVQDAYRKGYEDASNDLCRRLDELYSFGFEVGKADALAEAGMIELDDDVTEALGE